MSFIIDEKKYRVQKIIKQWYEPDLSCFKIMADNNYVYVLKYIISKDYWLVD